jgi:hypothetical protein
MKGLAAMPEVIDVDPGALHLPPSRRQGADPGKLSRQIARHGDSVIGMPPLQIIRGKGGNFRINDGVTRATRAAKLKPGQLIPAEVIQDLPNLDVTRMPKVKDTLP